MQDGCKLLLPHGSRNTGFLVFGSILGLVSRSFAEIGKPRRRRSAIASRPICIRASLFSSYFFKSIVDLLCPEYAAFLPCLKIKDSGHRLLAQDRGSRHLRKRSSCRLNLSGKPGAVQCDSKQAVSAIEPLSRALCVECSGAEAAIPEAWPGSHRSTPSRRRSFQDRNRQRLPHNA